MAKKFTGDPFVTTFVSLVIFVTMFYGEREVTKDTKIHKEHYAFEE